MSALSKLMCFGVCAGFIFGACCSNAVAQSAARSKRPPAGSSGSQRTVTPASDEEEAVPTNSGRATLNGRPRAAAPNEGTVRSASRVESSTERPVGQAMRIPKVTPEMEAILQEWEEKSSKVKRLEGTFDRRTYDLVFEVAQISSGKYCFQYPDKGSLHGIAAKIPDDAPKVVMKGKSYTVQPGPNERWVCDGVSIIKIDDKSKTYDKIQIPEQDRGQNIRNAPLPFVFGLKAREAKQRYEFILDPDPKFTNEKTIRVKVKPFLPQDLANYKEAEVILDRENCLPLAVRLTDPTGNKTDVYMFKKENMIVNSDGWKRWLVGDPLNPKLTGLKQLVHSDPAEDPGSNSNSPDRRNGSPKAIGPAPLSPRTKLRQTAELPEEEEAAPPPRKPVRPQPSR